jgi:peroxiredoxin Q/BCP
MKFDVPGFAHLIPARGLRAVASLLVLAAALTGFAAMTPAVGDAAPMFTLKKLDGQSVEFAQVVHGRGAVLVVLRGWPGYQCPFCTTQVYEYVGHATDFAARNLPVVMVYPGPAEALQAHAKEFLDAQQWPANFYYLIDPDYDFTKRYGLRWDEKGESAYPATFVVDAQGKIIIAHVSREHGDRLGAAALLRRLEGMK